MIVDGAEVLYDGRNVWVNSAAGCCIGRFSWAGIDIHHDAMKQIELGRQCLDCKKGPTTIEDWRWFVEEMKFHYNVGVPDECMPGFLKGS